MTHKQRINPPCLLTIQCTRKHLQFEDRQNGISIVDRELVLFTPFFIEGRGNNFFVCVSFSVATSPSSYLTVLHSITEEIVQQQVLQLCVPVKRFFDFTQEDTGGERKGPC